MFGLCLQLFLPLKSLLSLKNQALCHPPPPARAGAGGGEAPRAPRHLEPDPDGLRGGRGSGPGPGGCPPGREGHPARKAACPPAHKPLQDPIFRGFSKGVSRNSHMQGPNRSAPLITRGGGQQKAHLCFCFGFFHRCWERCPRTLFAMASNYRFTDLDFRQNNRGCLELNCQPKLIVTRFNTSVWRWLSGFALPYQARLMLRPCAGEDHFMQCT